MRLATFHTGYCRMPSELGDVQIRHGYEMFLRKSNFQKEVSLRVLLCCITLYVVIFFTWVTRGQVGHVTSH